LGRRRIDGGPGRSTFVQYIIANGYEEVDLTNNHPPGLWRAFVMRQVSRALHEGDLTSFVVDNKNRILWRFALCGVDTARCLGIIDNSLGTTIIYGNKLYA